MVDRTSGQGFVTLRQVVSFPHVVIVSAAYRSKQGRRGKKERRGELREWRRRRGKREKGKGKRKKENKRRERERKSRMRERGGWVYWICF